MTITTPTERPSTSDLDDLTHLFCACSPDLSLCGKDVSDDTVVYEEQDDECVVCLDLDWQPCPRCGT